MAAARTDRRVPVLEQVVERVERMTSLDELAAPVQEAVRRAVPAGHRRKDLLSGTWLGHPLHPMLTDVPIGAWSAAAVLDLVGGRRMQPASDVLIGVGLAAAGPTAAAGMADWSDLLGPTRRAGAVHAMANVAAVGLYGMSALARRRGRRTRGVALSLAGLAVLGVGGYLGGHLSYRRAVGVNRTADESGPDDWVEVLGAADLPEGEPTVVRAADAEVLLLRRGEEIVAISDTCSHLRGPLHEGEVDLEACTVTCPWHQSTFRLDDGGVVHGPATAPQPRYEARERVGRIEVRRLPADLG